MINRKLSLKMFDLNERDGLRIFAQNSIIFFRDNRLSGRMYKLTILRYLCFYAIIFFVDAIHNGKEAPPSLYRFFVDMSDCGGVLISSRFMITSANCVDGRQMEEMDVTARKVHRIPWAKSQFKRRFPISIKQSPWFPDLYLQTKSGVTRDKIASDFAIVALKTPISVCDSTFDPLAILLPLNDNETPEKLFKADRNHQCIQAGFGIEHHDGHQRDPLDTIVLKQQRLKKLTVDTSSTYGRSMDFSSEVPGTHPCRGDSGSPVFCIVDDAPVLVSVVNTVRPCAGDHSDFSGADIKNVVLPFMFEQNNFQEKHLDEIRADQAKCRAFYKKNGFLKDYMNNLNSDRHPPADELPDSFLYPLADSIDMDGSNGKGGGKEGEKNGLNEEKENGAMSFALSVHLFAFAVLVVFIF